MKITERKYGCGSLLLALILIFVVIKVIYSCRIILENTEIPVRAPEPTTREEVTKPPISTAPISELKVTKANKAQISVLKELLRGKKDRKSVV